MKELILTPTAQADIELIWDYTAERWGDEQAEHYTKEIRNICQSLASGRKQGRKAAVRSNYMKCVVGAHIIYYRVDGTSLRIIRILHGRMDADRHLN